MSNVSMFISQFNDDGIVHVSCRCEKHHNQMLEFNRTCEENGLCDATVFTQIHVVSLPASMCDICAENI